MEATEQFRLFLALSIPDKVKSAIEAAQTELRWVLPGKAARWARRDQFHLTLRFLRDVPVSQITQLIEVLRAACLGSAPLHLTSSRIGFFPDPSSPRVLWVGVRERDGRLIPLWTGLQSATQPFTAEPAETHFTGHVTLARLNRLPRTQVENLVKAAAQFEHTMFGDWTADGVELMRSELLPQGARHSCLATLPLSTADGNRSGLS